MTHQTDTESPKPVAEAGKLGGGCLSRIVRLLRVAWEGWLEVFIFVPSFCFRNVFFIERDGGPITYIFALAVLPVSPLIGASCGIAQALINIDEELCKPNDTALAPPPHRLASKKDVPGG
jgi:hypothetical protein